MRTSRPCGTRIVLTLLEALHDADVPLLLGTDAGSGSMGLVPGFTIHDELAALTAHGLTPYEAIQTGTVNASSAIGAMTGDDDFGTIEVGKRADLILVGENPLDDVSHIEEQLPGVMAAGTWYTADRAQRNDHPRQPMTLALSPTMAGAQLGWNNDMIALGVILVKLHTDASSAPVASADAVLV